MARIDLFFELLTTLMTEADKQKATKNEWQ